MSEQRNEGRSDVQGLPIGNLPGDRIDSQSLAVTQQIQKATQHAEFHETVQSLRRSRTIEYFLFILVAVVLIGVVWGQQRANNELRHNLYNNCKTGNGDSRQRNDVYVAIAHQLSPDSPARSTLLDAVKSLKPHDCSLYLKN